jgi:hypothetical protein
MVQKACEKMDRASANFESATGRMDSAVASMREMARDMHEREAAVFAGSDKVQPDLTGE